MNNKDKDIMGKRCLTKNYRWPGTYHITIKVKNWKMQPLGRITGNLSKPDGDADAPRVELTPIGRMVEHELLHSISSHYPMVEVQDHVIMPDHLHFIVVVNKTIISKSGREAHLGQIIAGFKKGCNRQYWALEGITPITPQGKTDTPQGKPAAAGNGTTTAGDEAPTTESEIAHLRPAVYPQGYKVPSNASTGREPLFDYRYVDVMPLREGQLAQQRQYIKDNPRSRLLRTSNKAWLMPHRATADSAVTLPALKGYLHRVCGHHAFDDIIWESIKQRLLLKDGRVVCDSYGDIDLLHGRLLPVVCHRRDAHLFPIQKERCLTAAAEGAILVSARISKGEQEIMDAAIRHGAAIILVIDNGMPQVFHPSKERITLCATRHLLLMTPWQYAYRHSAEGISVAECKAMNCIVQALCRQDDAWWKTGA